MIGLHLIISLIHQILLFFLLLLNQGIDKGVQEGIEGWEKCGTALLNASVMNFHIWSCLQGYCFFVSSCP